MQLSNHLTNMLDFVSNSTSLVLSIADIVFAEVFAHYLYRLDMTSCLLSSLQYHIQEGGPLGLGKHLERSLVAARDSQTEVRIVQAEIDHL